MGNRQQKRGRKEWGAGHAVSDLPALIKTKEASFAKCSAAFSASNSATGEAYTGGLDTIKSAKAANIKRLQDEMMTVQSVQNSLGNLKVVHTEIATAPVSAPAAPVQTTTDGTGSTHDVVYNGIVAMAVALGFTDRNPTRTSTTTPASGFRFDSIDTQGWDEWGVVDEGDYTVLTMGGGSTKVRFELLHSWNPTSTLYARITAGAQGRPGNPSTHPLKNKVKVRAGVDTYVFESTHPTSFQKVRADPIVNPSRLNAIDFAADNEVSVGAKTTFTVSAPQKR